MNINKQRFAICDCEEDYLTLMSEYLAHNPMFPFQVYAYTSMEEVYKAESPDSLVLLLVAENAYEEKEEDSFRDCMAILNESGVVRGDNIKNINKYQSAHAVLKEIMMSLEEKEQFPGKPINNNFHTSLIGMYSPIKRCLQTSFALTMSYYLASEKKVLYINMEPYSGIREMMSTRQIRDLGDLLYFISSDEEKFRMRLRTIIEKDGNLEYIPPLKAGQNLVYVTKEEWALFLDKLCSLEEYEYIVLDLSDGIQGLFDILRRCECVYTMTKDDSISKYKLENYEELLRMSDYEDVLKLSRKIALPQIKRVPGEISQYAHCELSEYCKEQVRLLNNHE